MLLMEYYMSYQVNVDVIYAANIGMDYFCIGFHVLAALQGR